MTASAPRIANKFLAGADDEVVEDSSAITAGQFVDLSVFFIALDAYQKLKGDEDAHFKKVRGLLTRYQSDMADGMEKYLLPLTDDSAFARFKSHINLGIRKTRGIPQAKIQAEVLSEVLRALSSRTSTLREVLSDSRAVASATKVGGVLANDAPASVLSGLAAIAPASRLRVTLNWVREAAEFAGASPSNIDLMLTDVSQAQMIGEDIHKVDVQISGADPVSAKAAELQGARQGLIADLGSVVESSKDPAVVLSTASAAIAQPLDYATKTARAQRLSPDQERAMMLRGKGIIAAGAGSGKTSVLASKVAYHINELGVPPGAIVATSFSRKSAAELRRRIDKYGADIPASAETGFGTTHSIAGKLMREYGGGGRDGLKSYEHSNAIRLAMEQVQMVGSSGEKPPEPTSMFDGMAATLPEPELVSGLTFKAACELAYQRRGSLRNPYLQSFIESYFNPRDQWYAITMRATKSLTDPRGLSEKQSAVLKDVFAKLDVVYSLRTDPNFMTPPEAPQRRQAAEGGKDNKDKGLREKYTYFSKPANQWFNLGLSLTEEGPNGEKKPIPSGVFKQAITKYKGKAISPSEAWALSNGTPEAAVYAAYEWIKGGGGELDFQGRGDFDDVLLDVSKMMLSNPRILRQVQSRFKVVLVDEAQDLNRCVHGDTKVETPDGPVQIRDITPGAQVLSYENGQVVYNRVLDKVRSSWGRGYRIHLTSGETLLMSPNHRIYATTLDACPEGQMALYLMYRKDLGFRIGTTQRLFQAREASVGRGSQEHADCAWILEVGESADILYKEQALSLKHATPTYIFEGTVRGCDQARIDRIFQEFGENGRSLLEKYDLDFGYPHWVAPAVDRGRFTRRVVNFCPHRGKGNLRVQRGSSVNMNWTEGDFDLDVPVYNIKGGRKMVGVLTVDYAEGRRIAQHVAERAGAQLVETLWVGSEKLPLITASGLLPGMKIPVWNGKVDEHSRNTLAFEDYKVLAQQLSVSVEGFDGRSNSDKRVLHQRIRDIQLEQGCPGALPPIAEGGGGMHLIEIESVEIVEGGDYWDIAVENAHNFFGNGILSHNSQHLMFGLITGYVDPTKVPNVANVSKMSELARDDEKMSAETYVFIGDDKQCVDRESIVVSKQGPKKVGDLQPGDEIQAYRNGKVVFQRVQHVVPSSWDKGFKVTTLSGHTLTMSPNHKLWASEPRTEEGQMAVYLMYRKDMGFRIGITNKGKADSGDEYLNSYGGRAFMEKAERLWILNIVEGREEALLHELDLSLTYGIPTMVFGGENRGLNQERIDAIFKKHGQNGALLLKDRHLSFNLPHWMSQSYTKHGRERHTIQFNAHGNQGSSVSLEWEGAKFDTVLSGFKISVTGERRRLRRWFNNYREGLAFAEDLAQRTEANLSYRLSTPEGVLRETTASGLFVGMSLPVLDEEHGSVAHDEIVSIEEVGGSFIDLEVMDASTFFANGILTSNSIYEFRSADPEAFIDMSDLVDGGAGFKTEVLKTNYRSGELIVEAANRLIKHNSKQIPMTCNANPQRVDRGGIEVVRFGAVEGRDMKAPAEWLAAQIAEDMEEGLAGKKGYDAYGVGLRSNAEAYAYGLEMLKKGIPFRSKANFFNDPTTKALVHWLTIADEGLSGDVDRTNNAVLGAVSAPATKLSPVTFADKMGGMATGNYLQWLQTNWRKVYSGGASWSDLVHTYVQNLNKVAALKGSPAEVVLEAVLSLEGFDGRSVKDVLLDRVREDEEALAEIRAESVSGTVTDEDIAEVAFAPLAPLKGLLGARPDLAEAMKYTRQLQAANAKLTAVDDPEAKGVNEPAVTLGTMHSWKGLEVENMFIPLVGGRFPRAGASEEDLASERRLAYVAVTRGENRVVVMDIPTVRMTKQGPIVQKSQFTEELCIPPAAAPGYTAYDESPYGEEAGEDDDMGRVASVSPFDEAAMDIYLASRGR